MKKVALITLLISTISLSLSACHHQESADEVSVGTIAGPESQLMQVAKQVALKRYELQVKIVTFNDYVQPNQALIDGDIDANSFQHRPYLQAQNRARGWQLVSVGKTFLYPMAIYSNKYKRLNQLPQQATIALPNDPSNETRALLLLEQQQLIHLRRHTNNITPNDISDNPKALEFKTFSAAFLPRTLDDVDAAIINTTFAKPAGLNPQQSLAHENSTSAYTNVIVTTRKLQRSTKIQELVKAFQSPAVLQKAQEIFGKNAIAGFSLAH